MKDRPRGGPAGRTGKRDSHHHYTASRVRHAGEPPNHLKHDPSEGRPRRRAPGRIVGSILDYLPRGNTLDADAFRRRHLLLCWILALHVPALFTFGVWRGLGAPHSALEVATPAVCLVLARVAKNRRVAAFFVTAGLVFCSSVIVHISGGTIEAHFHFFVLIGLIALYQDWVPFLWNVLFTVLSHGIGSAIGATLMFNHAAGQNRPWTWALVHGLSVMAACIGVIIFWRNTELEQQRGARLAAELAASQLAAAQAEAARRQSVSELIVNLARRNQSLLDRQLALIGQLEHRERAPEALAELFQLDHLATRIRRNAESLLVISGDDPPRRWGRPVALGEVVRAAAAEVEDYARVQVHVDEHLDLAGRAVADLAHLLAELIENATTFSPPTSEVRVRSHLVPGDGTTFLLSVEDTGVGMVADDMAAANRRLAEPQEVDFRQVRLGFHVVGRLARRYGLQVRLAPTPGGGVTALVSLPDDLVSERRQVAMPALGPGRVTAGALPEPQAWTVPDADTLARLVTPPVFAADTSGTALVRPWALADTRSTVGVPPPVDPTRDRLGPPGGGLTAEGLVRRVPGAALTPSLHRPRGDTGPAGAPRPNGPGPSTRDSARVRSMLSRFQAGQRAGRAAAQTPTDSESPQEEA
jgi:signal transduction histidine kinase